MISITITPFITPAEIQRGDKVYISEPPVLGSRTRRHQCVLRDDAGTSSIRIRASPEASTS